MPLEQLVEVASCPPLQWACTVTAEPSQIYLPEDRQLQYKIACVNVVYY